MSSYRTHKRNRRVVAITLLLAILSMLACEPIPDPKQRVVLIFSDVTSSLLPSENKEVVDLTCSVIDSLLPGTRYYVYPVQVEPQKLERIYEGVIAAPSTPAATQALKDARRREIEKKIVELYALIKKNRRPGPGSRDNHTCIIYTLEFAQNKFREFDRKNTDFELVYVSDMIEQCNTTPMGKPISLGQTNISEQIKLAQQTNLNLDLSYSNVSMIIPATSETYTAGGRPSVSDLKNFWEAILSHCGFDKEVLKSSEKFYFASGLPRRFDPAQVAAADLR